MNNIQQILRILMPIIKGLPLIIGIMVVLIFIATKMVFYATPLYETTGRMKLEDVNMGISNTNLYKDFDIFTHPNKIMAEVEVIKSDELLREALSRLPFDISYYRIGKIRTTELFYDTPFKVKYSIEDEEWYGKQFLISIKDKQNFTLGYPKDGNTESIKKKFGDLIELDGISFTVDLNDSILIFKPDLKINDEFSFTINSMNQMVEEATKNVDVKEMDKDIPIVRIIYKNAVPEKAMLFTNTLMETYIQDGIEMRRLAARKTIDFIDSMMVDIARKLQESEYDVEKYRLANKITNTRMEVETGLKKVAEMTIQLANIEMNLASLEAIDDYVNKTDPDNFINKAPNYEGYGGLLYTELIKRLKTLQSEKKMLLQKYTPENEKVVNVESDIQNVIDYIKKNISNARKSMELQRDKIQEAILETEKTFKTVPTKEKAMIILERNFQLNQNIYNFLMEKRTESAIAESATLSFHRIIQKAELPTKPVSPKKTFTIIVFAFLGLLAGISLVYIYDAVSARIKYKDELEKMSSCPVIGDVRHEINKTDSMVDFLTLSSKLYAKSNSSQTFLITSGVDGEGKTFIAANLAKAFAQIGINTLLVSSDLRDKKITESNNLVGKKGFVNYVTGENIKNCFYPSATKKLSIMPTGISDLIPEAVFAYEGFQEKMTKLKEKFPIVIWDSPSFDTAIDALSLMKTADSVLYIFRANFSKTKLAIEPDLFKAEYGFEHIRLILNDVPNFAKDKKARGIRYTIRFWMRKSKILFRKYIKR